MNGSKTIKGVLIRDSASKSLKTLFLTLPRIAVAISKSVLDIKTANKKTKSIESILSINLVKIAKSIELRAKETAVNFKAFNDKLPNALSLSLDAESKAIITSANMPIVVKNISGNPINLILLSAIPANISNKTEGIFIFWEIKM